MLRVVSSAREFEKVQSSWDELAKTGTNWHLLSGFVRSMMLHCESKGMRPVAILELLHGEVVGISAFVTQRRYGFKVASFLLPRDYSPDFEVVPEHRESFVELTLEVLFERMKCQFVFLSLEKDSPQAVALDGYCRKRRLTLRRSVTSKHSVLMVDKPWEDFERLRGVNFKRRVRRIEGKLTRSGAWTTARAKANTNDSADKIRAVETHSWKHQSEKNRESIPAGLQCYTDFRGSSSLTRFAPDVWFLELDGTPIAYAIVLEMNGIAFLVKTSFDNRYEKLSPGEYVLTTAIRSLFDDGRISKIDFMTGLPFMRRWTTLKEQRETIRMSRGGQMLALLDFIHERLPYRVLKFSKGTLRISLEPA